jgi:hypothetical protein
MSIYPRLCKPFLYPMLFCTIDVVDLQFCKQAWAESISNQYVYSYWTYINLKAINLDHHECKWSIKYNIVYLNIIWLICIGKDRDMENMWIAI